MADLNALIAQGPEFYAPPDPFAQYAKMQQLEQASSTNQLNRMKMEDYRRKADVTNRLGALDPAAADYLAQIKRIDPKLGFDLEEQSIKSKNLGFTGTETQAKIEETKRKLLDSSMRNMASNPSDENIIAHTQDYELNSLFANELPSIKATAKRLLGMTPEQRKAVLSGAGATAGDLSTAESSRLGRLTTERGQDLTAAAAKAGQKVTMRGQDMTAATAAAAANRATNVKPLTEAQTIKLRTDIGKDYKAATTALSQIDDILLSSDSVKTAPGLSAATGYTGKYLPSFSEGKAAQAETRLANLRGKVTALGKATAAMSGSIGSIANQEWKILADQIAVLDEVKGKKPLLEQIDLVEAQAKGAAERIRDAYEKTRAEDFERFPQFRNLPESKLKSPAPAAAPAGGGRGFKYLGKESTE